MPDNGRCICGVVPYFQRSGVIGQPGHFHCRRCRRRYSFGDGIWWTPQGIGFQAPLDHPLGVLLAAVRVPLSRR